MSIEDQLQRGGCIMASRNQSESACHLISFGVYLSSTRSKGCIANSMREFSILILWVLISTLRRRSGLSKSLGISRVLALLSVIWTNQPKVLLDMLLLEAFGNPLLVPWRLHDKLAKLDTSTHDSTLGGTLSLAFLGQKFLRNIIYLPSYRFC
ncbi:hypothetical protein HKD37_11G031284 [Glycine soja]|nr:hypothetical protein glysoja_008861 [Glycine soja]